MKKIILAIIVILISFAANAQEPEKKKESKATGAATNSSEPQGRAINESGVSVKTRPPAKSNVKSAVVPSSAADDKNKEDKKTSNKPE